MVNKRVKNTFFSCDPLHYIQFAFTGFCRGNAKLWQLFVALAQQVFRDNFRLLVFFIQFATRHYFGFRLISFRNSPRIRRLDQIGFASFLAFRRKTRYIVGKSNLLRLSFLRLFRLLLVTFTFTSFTPINVDKSNIFNTIAVDKKPPSQIDLFIRL